MTDWYWTAQLVGWGGYLLLSLGRFETFQKSGLDIAMTVVDVVVLSMISHLLRWGLKGFNWVDLSFKYQVIGIFPLCILASSLAQFVQLFILVNVVFYTAWESLNPILVLSYMLEKFVVLSLWVALYTAIKFIERSQRLRFEQLSLNLALRESEIKALKAQLNPHFLFNCLNNIRAIILIDPETARETVTRLSDLLRYAIEFSQEESTTVEKELEITRDYLELEKLQFGDRLSYKICCTPSLVNQNIPPMSIQLLVENAIKHSIAKRPKGGEILIEITQVDDQLSICVNNPGVLEIKNESEGIGIDNLKSRLSLLFDGRALFKIEQVSVDLVRAQIIAPILR